MQAIRSSRSVLPSIRFGIVGCGVFRNTDRTGRWSTPSPRWRKTPAPCAASWPRRGIEDTLPRPAASPRPDRRPVGRVAGSQGPIPDRAAGLKYGEKRAISLSRRSAGRPRPRLHAVWAPSPPSRYGCSRMLAKAQIGIMLQRLLAERFGLVVHRETRQLPGYRLVVAKGGPRLTQSAAAAAKTGEAAPGPAPAQNEVVVKNGIPKFSDSAGTGTLMTLAGTLSARL